MAFLDGLKAFLAMLFVVAILILLPALIFFAIAAVVIIIGIYLIKEYISYKRQERTKASKYQ